MRTGFDLSPVIDLLDALSPTPTNPFLPNPTTVAAAGVVRSLGDFPALWQFLEDCRTGGDFAPFAPPQKELTPPPSPLPHPEKRRRRKKNTNVTFDDSITNPGPSSATDTNGHTDTTEEIPRPAAPRFLVPASVAPPPRHGLAAVAVEAPRRPVILPRLSASERKAQLMQMIISLFPADAHTLLNLHIKIPQNINLPNTNTNIHVFIDNSNILIGFYELVKKLKGHPQNAHVRAPSFSFHNLSLILERGRIAVKKVLVGSLPITPVVREAEALGYETSMLERVCKERVSKYQSSSSGSESTTSKTRTAKVEQAVDEILHLKILESILDFPPTTIVLASGDAAAGEYSPGFFRVVERALERGWKIELASFKKCLSFQYKARDFKEKWSRSFRFIPLDQFAEFHLDENSA